MAKRKKTTGKKRTGTTRAVKTQTSELRTKKTTAEQMSKKTMLIVGVAIAVVLIIIIATSLRSSEDNRGDASSTSGGTRSSVTVTSGALVDSSLRIDSYSLSQPGFITVHLALPDGAPGVIVGKSGLLTGQGSDISIRIGGNQMGKNVVLGVYFDNGDGRFAVSTDSRDTTVTRPIRLS